MFKIQRILYADYIAFTCFLWLSEQTNLSDVYCINWLVFKTQVENVYCAVHNESLYNTDTIRL